MGKFVLDCSMAIAWCMKDEESEYANEVISSMQNASALVPAIWHIEVSNVLFTNKKRGRLSESMACALLYDLDSLPIETYESDVTKQHLLTLSCAYDMTAYDACYLDLCMTHNLPLATLDKKLAQSLIASGGRLYAP